MNCADRAYNDLCLRVLKAISSLAKVRGTSLHTRIHYGECYIEFYCEGHRHHVNESCLSICTTLSEDEETIFRKSYVCPCIEQREWQFVHVICESEPPSTVCQQLWRKLSMWTFLGRTHSQVHHMITEPSCGYPGYRTKCFVCSSDFDPDTEPLCGKDECWLCLDAFESFSCAIWCLKQIIPRDVSNYIGKQMSAINCAMLPARSWVSASFFCSMRKLKSPTVNHQWTVQTEPTMTFAFVRWRPYLVYQK